MRYTKQLIISFALFFAFAPEACQAMNSFKTKFSGNKAANALAVAMPLGGLALQWRMYSNAQLNGFSLKNPAEKKAVASSTPALATPRDSDSTYQLMLLSVSIHD